MSKNLGLELSEEEIYQRLIMLVASDVIERDESDIDFRGLRDGTLKLILRNRFEKDLEGFEPDLKEEFKRLLLNKSITHNQRNL